MFYSSLNSKTDLANYLKTHWGDHVSAEDIEAWKDVNRSVSSLYSNDKLKTYTTDEKNGSCKLEVEVPGYNSENISIVTKKEKLLITIRKEAKAQKELQFTVSNKFDLTKITAKCKDGILTVLIPLKPEESPVTIQVL